MVLVCHQDSWECRAFRPSQTAPQAASPGTCTHRNRPPRCFLLVYKLTGPGSDSKAQVCKQHCFSLFSLTCLILPLALSLWPGVWVLRTPGHLSHPMRPFSSTRGSNCSFVLAGEAGVLRRLCPPQVPLPCSHLLRGLASSQSRTVGQGGPASWEPQTSALLTWVPASLLAASQMPLSFSTHGHLASLHL